jgi:hypothetical protein
MMRRFVAAVERFRNGEDSLLELSAAAAHAAITIDNASAPLPDLLQAASSDLEYAYFATERDQHASEAERILLPILELLDA